MTNRPHKRRSSARVFSAAAALSVVWSSVCIATSLTNATSSWASAEDYAELQGFLRMEKNPTRLIQAQASHCSSESQGNGISDFEAEISCEIHCSTDSASKTEMISAQFSPTQHRLRKGNGDLLGALGTTLSLWSRRECAIQAAQRCGGIQHVTQAAPKSMKSGAWQMALPYGCPEQPALVLSPYGQQLQGKLKPSNKKTVSAETFRSTSAVEELTVRGALLEKSQLSAEANAKSVVRSPSEDCRFPLSAQLCFGDCIDLSTSPNLESLSTPSPTRGELTVCGDALAQALLAKKRSRFEKLLHCEEFFWRSARASSSLYFACAAVRGNVNCDSFLAQIQSSGTAP
ncbi:MAG: hypothetical protein RJB38_1095 [Pseudomonadota bacterium]